MTSNNEQERTIAVVDYIRKSSELTNRKAIEGSAQLVLLKKEDNQKLFDSLANLIAHLDSSLNVGSKLTAPQAMEIVYAIINDFWELTFDEIVIAIRNGKQGKYGKNNKTYNRLDIEVVCGWLDAYRCSNERMDLIEANRYKYKAELNKPINPDEINQEGVAALRTIRIGLEQSIAKKKQEAFDKLPSVNLDAFDKRMEEGLSKFVTELPEEELIEYEKKYSEAGYKRTVGIIQTELKRRKNLPKNKKNVS